MGAVRGASGRGQAARSIDDHAQPPHLRRRRGGGTGHSRQTNEARVLGRIAYLEKGWALEGQYAGRPFLADLLDHREIGEPFALQGSVKEADDLRHGQGIVHLHRHRAQGIIRIVKEVEDHLLGDAVTQGVVLRFIGCSIGITAVGLGPHGNVVVSGSAADEGHGVAGKDS